MCGTSCAIYNERGAFSSVVRARALQARCRGFDPLNAQSHPVIMISLMICVDTFSEGGMNASNQDAFEVNQHPRDAECWLFALADGQGGRSGGGQAAAIACRTVINSAKEMDPTGIVKIAAWSTLLKKADAAVSNEPTAGFTTLIGFTITNGNIIGASNGDSAVVVRHKGITQELTASQQKNPPIGTGVAAIMPLAMKLDRGWLVLAMTDGVWKFVGWNRIIRHLRNENGKSLIKSLQAGARLPGNGRFPDDFTALAVEERDQ